jgi:hypothetical protein
MVPAVITIIVIVLAASLLAFYAIRTKVRLKISATALKWFSFTIEVDPRTAICHRGNIGNVMLLFSTG